MTMVNSAPHCLAVSGGHGGQRHGRGERIRTSGPCLPKTVLYQAELLPDRNPPQATSVAAGAIRAT